MDKYFTYDDEYISGWQYFFRTLLNTILAIILVGLYLQSVNSYKRARSLGNSSTACNLFGIWGFRDMGHSRNKFQLYKKEALGKGVREPKEKETK